MLIAVAVTPLKNRFTRHNISHKFRIATNFITLEIVKDYPIIGTGFGMQAYGKGIDLDAYNERVPEKYRSKNVLADPHSILFSIAVRVGFIGLVLFLYIIFKFLKMCWESTKHGKDDFVKNWGLCIASAFIAFFVIGSFEPVFSHVPEVVLFTIFSMITILWRLNTE
jgi:O-antigen ligase